MGYCNQCGTQMVDNTCPKCGYQAQVKAVNNKSIVSGVFNSEEDKLHFYRFVSAVSVVVGVILFIIVLFSIEKTLRETLAYTAFLSLFFYCFAIIMISLYSFRFIIFLLLAILYSSLSVFMVNVGLGISLGITYFALAFFIGSLFLSYKKYFYDNKQIIVYAGWFHNYVKVDGVKVDEHNTCFNIIPIQLSCRLADGTELKATISMTNRISLKVNDLLCHTK